MKMHDFKTTTGKQLRLSEEEIRMVLELESKGFGVDHIQTENGTTTVKFTDGTVGTYQKITFSERKQEPAPLSLYDQMIKALQSLRPVYITDGTVTRLVTAVEYLDSEVRCTLDDGARFFLYPGFNDDFSGELGCLEAEEGFYLAPRWWIDL